MKKTIITLTLITFFITGCDTLQNLNISDIDKMINTGSAPKALTNDEVIKGLKEALNVGTNNAVKVLNREDGFFKDPLLKILFPPEAQVVADKLRQVGLGDMVDKMVLKMNRGAESAVSKATPIFVSAITRMTIQDAMGILKGSDNAATTYFKNNTSNALFNSFRPEVQKVLDQMEVTKYWGDVTTAYNKIPLTKKVETDLTKYVTDKAIAGLFNKIEKEEKAIRENPAARVNDILKRVFGSLD